MPTATVTALSVLSGVDPRNTSAARSRLTPYLADAQMFHPVGPTPAFHFDGWGHVETALNQVAPRGDRGWHAQITSVSVEGQAVRLGQLIQAGRVSLDRPRLAADLTRKMPGTAPFEGAPDQPPSIAVTLYNPRRSTHADDVTLDQLHNTTDTVSTAAGADHSFATSLTGLFSGDDDNHEIAGINAPVAQRQTQPSAFGGTTTGSRRDWLKSGSTAAPANGGRGTRSYAVDVDAHLLVEGPEGVRHVTGTVTLRVEERDLLGHGLLGPAESPPNVHDLPALVPDWATAEPQHPARTSAFGDPGRQPWRPALGGPRRGPAGRASGAGSLRGFACRRAGQPPAGADDARPTGHPALGVHPDGALVTDDPDLTTAWTAFHTQAEILHTATDTLDDTPQILTRLFAARKEANRVHADAVGDSSGDGARGRGRVGRSAAGDGRGRRIRPGRARGRGRGQGAGAGAGGRPEGRRHLAVGDSAACAGRGRGAPRPPDGADRADAGRACRTHGARRRRTGGEGQAVERRPRSRRARHPAFPRPGGRTSPTTPACRPRSPRSPPPTVRSSRPPDNSVPTRAALATAQETVARRPADIRRAKEVHKKAQEKTRQDAADVVRRTDELRDAGQREADARGELTDAENEAGRREGQVVAAVTAQIQAAADRTSATDALPGLSTAVRDSAPNPEQSPRTTFATTPPRWPTPDGRTAPLPAAGQTHTPATTATSTSTPTPVKQRPKQQPKQQPKKSGPAKSGTSKGKGKPSVVQPPLTTTTPAANPLSPYVTPTGRALATPGDGYCLLYAVIGSDPQLVADRLGRTDPGTAGWLAQPQRVRGTLTTMTGHPQTADQGSGYLRAARQGLQDLVLTRLAAARDGSRPLPPQVLGQLRGVLADDFAATVANASDADVDNRLLQYGIQGMTRAEDLDPADLQTRYLQAVTMPGAPPHCPAPHRATGGCSPTSVRRTRCRRSPP
ncbi:hypothetical protein ACRAWF_43475 [Streptomyces sp. L7]